VIPYEIVFERLLGYLYAVNSLVVCFLNHPRGTSQDRFRGDAFRAKPQIHLLLCRGNWAMASTFCGSIGS
jgi:hypothetical protein